MTSTSIRSLIAGVLMANSAPHVATALTGHEHMTPLRGRDSSPRANAVWAAFNLAGSAALLLSTHSRRPRWDTDLLWFEAGYLAFATWMVTSERVVAMNWDRTVVHARRR